MISVWLGTVSLLFRETYLHLFAIYLVAVVLFLNKSDIKL